MICSGVCVSCAGVEGELIKLARERAKMFMMGFGVGFGLGWCGDWGLE